MAYQLKDKTGGMGYLGYSHFLDTLRQGESENREIKLAYEDASGKRSMRRVLPLELSSTSRYRQVTLKAIDLDKNAPRNFTSSNVWSMELGEVMPETDTDVAMQMFYNFFEGMGINPEKYRFEVTYNKPEYATIGLRATLNTNEFISFQVRINKKHLNRESVAENVSLDY